MLDPDNKDSLRAEAIRNRERIDVAEDNPEDAVAHFFDHVTELQGKIVSGYWPKGREFDDRPILDELLRQGIQCALPVVQKESRVLQFAAWKDGESLEEGAFGVMVPEKKDFVEPDILLVPLLAFDRHGYRLGYGGGYYDATLAALKAKKSIISVGIAYARQAVLFNLPREEHDQPMDWIMTPQRAIYYGGRS